jgi:hypothetical protein
MPRYLNKTIVALTTEVAASMDGARDRSLAPYDDVVQFVLDQLNRMPWLSRTGVNICTAMFGVSLLFSKNRFLCGGKAGRTKSSVEAWRASRLGICRDLMKLYTSLVALSLYSRVETNSGRDIP